MEETVEYSKHFSHEHPLEYVNSRYDIGDCICSGCKLTITPNKFFYHCRDCKFSLNKVCYGMPRKVMHPADPNHRLTLMSPSSLTDQSNECGACGRYINGGFYYTCRKCSLYYHMLCVAMPLSAKIPNSHPHILKLEMKPPYDCFECDLCDRHSYSGWVYRCRLCEFDAHALCAVTYKGTQSSRQMSGLEDDTSHQYELMELLSQVNNYEKQNFEKEQLQPLDQSILISENFTLPSYNFSDACFSIDIVKPTTVNEAFNHQVKPIDGSFEVDKRQILDVGKKDLKREPSLALSTGIGSRVWEDLGRENKDQTPEIDNVNSRRSFWFKLLVCS